MAEGIGDDLMSWRSGGAFCSESVGIDLLTLNTGLEREALDKVGGADSVRSITAADELPFGGLDPLCFFAESVAAEQGTGGLGS